MTTSTLPTFILNEKRSNIPFFLCLSLISLGLSLVCFKWVILGAIMSLLGFASMVSWTVITHRRNEMMFNALTQAELVSMLGRDSETSRSSDSVVRVLNRRFPSWRETVGFAG